MDTQNNNPIQKQWLSLVAILTASMAFIGLNSPIPKTQSNEGKKDPKESPVSLVSFSQKSWEDPFAQAKEAKKLTETDKTNSLQQGDFDTLLDTLLELLCGKPINDISPKEQKTSTQQARLLVALNIVKGSDLPESVENRIRTRHANELALSNYQFHPLLSGRVAYVSLKGLTTYLTEDRQQTVNLDVPVKLYLNETTGQFVLNLWLDQDHLGAKPWRFLASVLAQVKSPKHKLLLRPLSAIAIVGPVDSDVLQKMEPDERTGNAFALKAPYPKTSQQIGGGREKCTIESVEPFSGWISIHWISASSTVPRFKLWRKEDKVNWAEPNRVQVEFVPIVDLDDELIDDLSYELKTRLGGFSVAKRQLLLFVEQDQKYGRNLGEMLRSQFDSFDYKVIPYLRGLSETKESPEFFSKGAAVSDYFQRTLARTTESWSYADAESFKPAAIGILGGTWNDKMLLLEVVRKRFPQSLVFTNDCDVRFLDPKHLSVTRNLIIASHQDPMPRVERSDTELSSIAFRDEYQATHFIGVSTLISKVFFSAYKDGPKLLEQKNYGSCVFEVANAGLLKMPSEEVESNPFSPVVGGIGAGIVILGLFLFPFAYKIRQFSVWLFAILNGEPQIRTEDQIRQDKSWLKSLWFWSPIVACFLVILFSIALVPKLESSGIRYSNLFSGVSVIPSIILLSISIPGTFRRTFRPERSVRGRHEQANRIQVRVRKLQRAVSGTSRLIRPARQMTKQVGQVLKSNMHRLLNGILSFAIGIAGFLVWYWTDDVWLLQIGLLGLLTCCLPSRSSMQVATLATVLIGLGIGILRFYAYDYSLVPARDSMLRAVGSCCFAVAYWWLLVGLLKLLTFYWRLRSSLRIAASVLADSRETKVINSQNAGQIYGLLTEIGDLSQRISGDLASLTLVGLLVCVARLPIFDAWGMSFATWLTIVLPMALPFVFAIVLRRRAMRFRESATQFLERSINEVEPSAAASDKDKNAIKDLLSRIKTYDKGAFAPLDRDPLISAGFAILLALFSGPNNDIAKKIFGLFIF